MGLPAQYDDESVLFRAGSVYTPVHPAATALVVDGGRIAWLGEAAEAPSVDRVIDLGDVLVTPAFVDSHVHTTDAGLVLSGLDVSGCRSAAEIIELVAGRARVSTGVIIGHGW